MNNIRVKKVTPNIGVDESYFDCHLSNNRLVSIDFTTFYDIQIKQDSGLELHSMAFETWEDLTMELLDSGYDFENKLQSIINNWSDKQLKHYSKNLVDDDDDINEEEWD